MQRESGDDLDLIFRALGDASRRGMIDRLGRGPASVSELAQPLEMALPSVLKHLQVRESSGWVRSQKAGRIRTYSLQPRALRQLERWVARRSAFWHQRFDRLERCLRERPKPPARGSK